MYISKKELLTITNILEKFPDVETFKLTQESSSGIGSILSISFDHTFNGEVGKFTIEVSGVENW